MRKYGFVFLVLSVGILLSAILSVGAADISLSVSDIDYGETLSLTARLEENEGFCAYAVDFLYDSEYLRLDRVTNLCEGKLVYSEEYGGVGDLRIVYSDSNDRVGDLSLFKIDFTLLKKSDNPLSLSLIRLSEVCFTDSQARTLPLTLSGASLDTQAPRLWGLLGDADSNKTITTYDASLMLQSIVLLDLFDERTEFIADVNNDGAVTTYDVSLLLQYIVKLPVEYGILQNMYK